MTSRSTPFQIVATCYLLAAGGLVAWAWYIDVSLLARQHEHLLPDFLLMLVGLPSSLLLGPFYQQWPEFFAGLAQIACVTICALLQSGLLVVLAFQRGRHAKA